MNVVTIAGTLGCVFIDDETHENGVTECDTTILLKQSYGNVESNILTEGHGPATFHLVSNWIFSPMICNGHKYPSNSHINHDNIGRYQ